MALSLDSPGQRVSAVPPFQGFPLLRVTDSWDLWSSQARANRRAKAPAEAVHAPAPTHLGDQLEPSEAPPSPPSLTRWAQVRRALVVLLCRTLAARVAVDRWIGKKTPCPTPQTNSSLERERLPLSEFWKPTQCPLHCCHRAAAARVGPAGVRGFLLASVPAHPSGQNDSLPLELSVQCMGPGSVVP